MISSRSLKLRADYFCFDRTPSVHCQENSFTAPIDSSDRLISQDLQAGLISHARAPWDDTLQNLQKDRTCHWYRAAPLMLHAQADGSQQNSKGFKEHM